MKSKIANWNDVHLTISGKKIEGIKPFTFEEFNNTTIPIVPTLKMDFDGEITVFKEDLAELKKFLTHAETINHDGLSMNRLDLIKLMKAVGVILVYGAGSNCVAMNYKHVFEVDNEILFEQFLQSIPQEEWMSER